MNRAQLWHTCTGSQASNIWREFFEPYTRYVCMFGVGRMEDRMEFRINGADGWSAKSEFSCRSAFYACDKVNIFRALWRWWRG